MGKSAIRPLLQSHLLDDCDHQVRLSAAHATLRAAAAFRPAVPEHQYHSPQSRRVGILTPAQPHSSIELAVTPTPTPTRAIANS